jgi:hypothetical protein
MTGQPLFAAEKPAPRRAGPAPRRLRYLAEILRAAGPRFTAGVIRRQLLDTRSYLGLRCELKGLPPVPAAQVDMAMVERDVAAFSGFETELGGVSGSDAYETLLRIWSCQAGSRNAVRRRDRWRARLLPVADPTQPTGDDRPPLTRKLLPAPFGRGAARGRYTFTAFRGKRAMAAGMAQLLHTARDEGATAAITYVAADNVPSLKGCARVGFELDHQRITVLRLGRRHSRARPIDAVARAAWARAIG